MHTRHCPSRRRVSKQTHNRFRPAAMGRQAFGACRMLCAACRTLRVARCMLHVARCMLHDAVQRKVDGRRRHRHTCPRKRMAGTTALKYPLSTPGNAWLVVRPPFADPRPARPLPNPPMTPRDTRRECRKIVVATLQGWVGMEYSAPCYRSVRPSAARRWGEPSGYGSCASRM